MSRKELVQRDMGNSKIINLARGTSIGDGANVGQFREAVVPDIDYSGSVDATAAIQAALLSFGTLGSWVQGAGGRVALRAGKALISKPLIIPSGVEFTASGWGSQLQLATDSQCDMIQFATHNSSAQATILGVSASTIMNAYYAKVSNMALHGDAFTATVPAYYHGIHITTDPVSTAATGGQADPAFDPMQTIENVWIKAVTGDAVNHENGRSGALLKRIYADSCNGLAYALGTDTSILACVASFCGGGFYMNHTSNVGSACKSYNNGIGQWVSGYAYVTGTLVISAGLMYWCIASVTSATAPASDATHWTELTAATAPWASGKGYYFDTNAGEQSWTGVDSQENCEGDYYVAGPNNGAISIVGTSSNVNFNNGQPDYNSANPNNYAAVTLDGAIGTNVNITTKTNSAGHGIVCRVQNSPVGNVVIAATDGSESSMFSGGYPEIAIANGTVVAAEGITTGGLTFSSRATKTANYTMTIADTVILMDCTSAAFTVTLPDATLCAGEAFFIKQVDTSTHTGIIAPHSGQSIDANGAGSWELGSRAVAVLMSDGSNFQVLSGYGTTENNLLDDGHGNATFAGLLSTAGGKDSSAFSAITAPSFTSGTAKQLSTVSDCVLYLAVKTAASQTFALAIGSTSSTTTALVASGTMTPPIGTMMTIMVPKGNYVKFTGTVADWTFVQQAC